MIADFTLLMRNRRHIASAAYNGESTRSKLRVRHGGYRDEETQDSGHVSTRSPSMCSKCFLLPVTRTALCASAVAAMRASTSPVDLRYGFVAIQKSNDDIRVQKNHAKRTSLP